MCNQSRDVKSRAGRGGGHAVCIGFRGQPTRPVAAYFRVSPAYARLAARIRVGRRRNGYINGGILDIYDAPAPRRERTAGYVRTRAALHSAAMHDICRDVCAPPLSQFRSPRFRLSLFLPIILLSPSFRNLMAENSASQSQ